MKILILLIGILGTTGLHAQEKTLSEASVSPSPAADVNSRSSQNPGTLTLSLPQNFEFRLHGDADFFAELAHQPTSIQGQSRFDFALLQLSPQIRLNQELALHFRFVLADERSSGQKNYYNQVQNAFIEYRDHRFQKLTHELGLIRRAWITSEDFASRLDFFGVSGRSLVRRYGLISEGDLGYQARVQQNEHWSWVVGAANGEENKSDEQGPNKDAFAGAFFKNETLRFQAWLSVGRVDRVEPSIAERERLLLRLEKIWGRMQMAIEGLYAQDPSVDLDNQRRLGGISFTELTDPRKIQTIGGRAELAYQLNDQHALMARYDHLIPQWERKKIQSMEAAWIKRESEYMNWGVFYEKTDYGTQHSSQAQHQEWGRVGLGLSF